MFESFPSQEALADTINFGAIAVRAFGACRVGLHATESDVDWCRLRGELPRWQADEIQRFSAHVSVGELYDTAYDSCAELGIPPDNPDGVVEYVYTPRYVYIGCAETNIFGEKMSIDAEDSVSGEELSINYYLNPDDFEHRKEPAYIYAIAYDADANLLETTIDTGINGIPHGEFRNDTYAAFNGITRALPILMENSIAKGDQPSP